MEDAGRRRDPGDAVCTGGPAFQRVAGVVARLASGGGRAFKCRKTLMLTIG